MREHEPPDTCIFLHPHTHTYMDHDPYPLNPYQLQITSPLWINILILGPSIIICLLQRLWTERVTGFTFVQMTATQSDIHLRSLPYPRLFFTPPKKNI